MQIGRLTIIFLGVMAGAMVPASAQTAVPAIGDIAFLAGDWTVTDGRIFLWGARPEGSTAITVEAGGQALIVREKSLARSVEGEILGRADAAMLLYVENGSIHGDHINGRVTTHFRSLSVTPGQALVLATEPAANGAIVRLSYELQDTGKLRLTRDTLRPGDTAITEFTQLLEKRPKP
jgi:hypothetical protein